MGELIINDYVILLMLLLITIIFVATSYVLVKQNKPWSLLSLFNLILVFFLFQYIVKNSLTTTIVMPDKNNLRIAEDGKLSFCLDGLARTWTKTENGIISTKRKYIDGRRMECLTLSQSIELLIHNGATEEQIDALRNIYSE